MARNQFVGGLPLEWWREAKALYHSMPLSFWATIGYAFDAR
jgi:hypothetical protein